MVQLMVQLMVHLMLQLVLQLMLQSLQLMLNKKWTLISCRIPHLDEGCGLRKYFKISNCSQQRQSNSHRLNWQGGLFFPTLLYDFAFQAPLIWIESYLYCGVIVPLSYPLHSNKTVLAIYKSLPTTTMHFLNFFCCQGKYIGSIFYCVYYNGYGSTSYRDNTENP